MSKYVQALVEQMTDEPTWGWMITEDLLADSFDDDDKLKAEMNQVGRSGPSRIPDEILEELQRRSESKWRRNREGFHTAMFRLYDDDDNLVARGRLIWTGDEEPDEAALASPLFDFGRGCWGCTQVKYDGHPSWEIG